MKHVLSPVFGRMACYGGSVGHSEGLLSSFGDGNKRDGSFRLIVME